MNSFAVYFHKKLIIVCLLGFSSGLPRLLVASTLGAMLSDNAVEKTAIGLFAYVALPYSFNFLWAPLIDHLRLPIIHKLGQRVSWMLLAQIGVALSLIVLGYSNPAETPVYTAIAAICVAFFSASQDIIIDAYRTEYLEEQHYGHGAAMAVFGYRLGMLVAGAGALWFAADFAWELVYSAMALCMVVGAATVLYAGEPQTHREPIPFENMQQWLGTAVITPFTAFAKMHKNWLWLLLFVALFRMPDGFIGFMSTPFMLDIGFEKKTIAEVGKLYGFIATLVGTFIGGALVLKVGLWASLLIFGLAQLLTNLAYILLTIIGPQIEGLMLAITLDNLAGGGVTAAAIALMMRLCDKTNTATQYDLLASLASLASIMLAGAAGWVADEYSWTHMFILSGIMGIPALVILFKIKDDKSFK